MSGGNSSKNRARSSKRQEGWEEAGGEFYQELYPGGEQELFDNLQRADAAKLATLLPSKQARNTTTVKRARSQNDRRQSTFARTTQSRDIHLSMLPDLSENLSNEERTWEEIMQIKAMPVPMNQKRELKARLQGMGAGEITGTMRLSNLCLRESTNPDWAPVVDYGSRLIGWLLTKVRTRPVLSSGRIWVENATKLRLQGLEQFQWRQRKVWHRLRVRCSEVVGKLELWHSPMREIEGKFGTGVVSYFLFLRWLLFLNLGISLLIISFLIVPKTVLVEDILPCETENSTICCSQENSTICCSQYYFEKNNTDTNVFLDLIQGTGIMERTILFYGVYTDQIYSYHLKMFDSQFYYNMPMAYILVPISWVLISLIAIVKTAAKGFKERLIESEGQFYMYCNLVFGGWDFCIHNEKSAKIKHKALYNEVKGCLETERFKEEKQSRTRESVVLLHLKRLLMNVLVLCILIASGILIYIAFNYAMFKLNEELSNEPVLNNTKKAEMLTLRLYRGDMSFGQLENTLLEFLPFLTIVVLNIVVPEIFACLVKFENYTPARVILITLLRTVLLRLSSLGVLLSQIYIYVSTSGFVCAYTNVDPSKLDCWETYVGQQLYKLILTDFAVQFITTFIINLPRAFIARHTSSRCLKYFGEQDFYLPKHVLDIVYTQTIIWMGSFFCPFLPIMGTIFYFLTFYIKKFTCLVNCTPSPVVYKASKSKSLFMSVLLLGFIVSTLPVAYSVAEVLPSINCGPFRGYNTVWEFVVQTFEGFPFIIREIIFLIGTSTFGIPAFAVLLLFLYYYWAVASANRHMVTVLKNQLVLEGHDKQFLLNRLSAFIRQHQKRCERRNRASFADDDSSCRQSSR